MNFSEELYGIRNNLINRALLGTAICVLPTLISSIIRYVELGWHYIYVVHLIISVMLFGLYVWREKVSLKLKSHLLINLIAFVAFIGTINFKMVGGSYLVLVSIVISLLIFGRKIGFYYFIFFMTVFALIAALHINSIIPIAIDFNDYMNNTSSWITYMVGMMLSGIVFVYFIGLFYQFFSESIFNVLQKTDELNSVMQKLSYSEERFRKFNDNYPFPIAIKNSSSQYVYGNKALYDLFNVRGNDVENIRNSEVFTRELAESLDNSDRVVLLNNQYMSFDVTGWIPDIGKQYYHIIKFPLEGPEGEFLIGSITINTTKQVEAEEKLEISEKKYRSIFEGSIDGFIFLDENFKVLEVNESFMDVVGFQRDELIGEEMTSFLADDTLWNRKLRTISERGYSGLMELDYVHKSGSVISVEQNVYELNLGEKQVYWTVFRDVSERKQIDKRLFKVMLEAEEHERGRYARELHDGLGPLLSTCKIYFHSLLKVDGEKQKEYINRAGELLEEAINSIKEISNNLSPDVLSRYGIGQALKSFVSKLKNVSSIQFKIEVELADRISELLEFTIYRALVELINNSLKYSQANNVIILIQRLRDGRYFVKFSDDGIGFDYEKVKLENKGFGLLNIENRIKKIGGEFQHSSSPGEGVVVEFILKNGFK